jgi:hypothetical protein
MSHGFEIYGPGGQLWFNSNDLTVRAVGAFRLWGTSGNIYNAAINPNSTYSLAFTHYYTGDIAYQVGPQYMDAVQNMPASGALPPKITVSFHQGRVYWQSNIDLGGYAYLSVYSTG